MPDPNLKPSPSPNPNPYPIRTRTRTRTPTHNPNPKQVSSDNMSPGRDTEGHAAYSAGGTFNTG